MFVKICFRDILNEARHLFSGQFDAQWQQLYLPSSSKGLVTMVLRGANVKNPYFYQAALTVPQLMIFNSTVRTHKASSQALHTTKQEPPIAVYLGQCCIHKQGSWIWFGRCLILVVVSPLIVCLIFPQTWKTKQLQCSKRKTLYVL